MGEPGLSHREPGSRAGLLARCVRSRPVGVRPPSGTVTFLFTDVVGSTGLWEHAPNAMPQAIARHDALLNAAVDAHDGYVFATAGDGLAAAFARAGDAVRAAIDAQAALLAEQWPAGVSISVRMGLH